MNATPTKHIAFRINPHSTSEFIQRCVPVLAEMYFNLFDILGEGLTSLLGIHLLVKGPSALTPSGSPQTCQVPGACAADTGLLPPGRTKGSVGVSGRASHPRPLLSGQEFSTPAALGTENTRCASSSPEPGYASPPCEDLDLEHAWPGCPPTCLAGALFEVLGGWQGRQ